MGQRSLRESKHYMLIKLVNRKINRLQSWARSILAKTESVSNVGDLGSIPGSRRSPGKGNENPLQYSCLENSMDRGDWRATVHGVTKSRKQLSH